MRTIDDAAIAAAGAVRRRSEYDYAVFEYLRSPKILKTLERCQVALAGRRVLDAGCGAGGTALSLAEEARFVAGLDIDARFAGTGTRLQAEKGVGGAGFVKGDGVRLPFADESFDLVLSHEVIEHIYEGPGYLRDMARVLRPGGVLYLSTAPYLSLTGAHLPRLRVPLPLHLLLGRRATLRLFHFLARHAPFVFNERRAESSFIKGAQDGLPPSDSLRQRIRVKPLREWITRAGFVVRHEELRVTGFFETSLPSPLRRFLAGRPYVQDVMIGHIEYVLEKAA
ncbi:MAG TPA: class I SAM-dependent methyltransferase [Vicinamibacteria bacterium]